MHILEFIQDMAVIMAVAGVVTVIFHHFKQPVVLGYILAGVIIGPHTPPFKLIHDEGIINTLAELGVILLLFSLGLEFSFRKLFRVGSTALIAAIAEIVLMVWVGFQIGHFFGWSTMDSIFLGAILSVSSTTIIIKALDGLKMKRERFAQLIFGILIVEDILAIGIIALLSTIATTGSVDPATVVTTIGKLALFIFIALLLGILIVPRLINYVANFQSNEMLLITVLGLCFGFCLLVLKMGYSVALGAFIIGAVIAESKQIHTIEKLIEPIRDMFSAIFFVAIGLLFDPHTLIEYAVPVLIITIAVVVGKLISCGVGTYVAGNDARTSMRVGMGLSQIGEFSFIIAALGANLNVTSSFIYPITVSVSAVTTLLTPYLIKVADPLSLRVTNAIPEKISSVFTFYTGWLRNIRPRKENAEIKKIIRRIVIQVIMNLALIVSIFIGAAYFAETIFQMLNYWVSNNQAQRAIVWGTVLVISLPFFIASFRKIQGLSMILAELGMKPNKLEKEYTKARKIISEVIPIISILGMLALVFVLSATILPAPYLLALVLIIVAVITKLLWKRLIWIHSKLQESLKETLDASK